MGCVQASGVPARNNGPVRDAEPRLVHYLDSERNACCGGRWLLGPRSDRIYVAIFYLVISYTMSVLCGVSAPLLVDAETGYSGLNLVFLALVVCLWVLMMIAHTVCVLREPGIVPNALFRHAAELEIGPEYTETVNATLREEEGSFTSYHRYCSHLALNKTEPPPAEEQTQSVISQLSRGGSMTQHNDEKRVVVLDDEDIRLSPNPTPRPAPPPSTTIFGNTARDNPTIQSVAMPPRSQSAVATFTSLTDVMADEPKKREVSFTERRPTLQEDPLYKFRVYAIPSVQKECETCGIGRPPLSTHCGQCNVCVSIWDHHCNWIANCVGQRTHRWFLWFLLSLTCYATIAFIASIITMLDATEIALGLIIVNVVVLIGTILWALNYLVTHIELVTAGQTLKMRVRSGMWVPGDYNVGSMSKVRCNNLGWFCCKYRARRSLIPYSHLNAVVIPDIAHGK